VKNFLNFFYHQPWFNAALPPSTIEFYSWLSSFNHQITSQPALSKINSIQLGPYSTINAKVEPVFSPLLTLNQLRPHSIINVTINSAIPPLCTILSSFQHQSPTCQLTLHSLYWPLILSFIQISIPISSWTCHLNVPFLHYRPPYNSALIPSRTHYISAEQAFAANFGRVRDQFNNFFSRRLRPRSPNVPRIRTILA
jgi:hypothetical protein